MKDGEIKNREAFGSCDGNELQAPGDRRSVRAHIWTAGNLGCFTGVLLDAPSGRASLSCNITGGYRVDGST